MVPSRFRPYVPKAAFAGLTLFLLWMGLDLGRFLGQCLKYRDLALHLPSSIHQKAPQHPEATVVLTGDKGRVPLAFSLLRERQSDFLIISGAGKGISLESLVKLQGSAKGIHENWSKVILESHSTSTLENAKNTGSILRSKGIEHIVLVTSDYHMTRALTLFRKHNPKTHIVEVPVASDFSTVGWGWKKTSLNGVITFFIEYQKYFGHRILGNL